MVGWTHGTDGRTDGRVPENNFRRRKLDEEQQQQATGAGDDDGQDAEGEAAVWPC